MIYNWLLCSHFQSSSFLSSSGIFSISFLAIVAFGNIIGWCERHFNKGEHKKRNGCLVAIILPLSTLFLGGLLAWGSWMLHPFAYYCVASVFVFYGLANHSLIQEGGEVIRTLEEQGLDAGRKRLSWIVGRDTSPPKRYIPPYWKPWQRI